MLSKQYDLYYEKFQEVLIPAGAELFHGIVTCRTRLLLPCGQWYPKCRFYLLATSWLAT
jgi:hypothetical protein